MKIIKKLFPLLVACLMIFSMLPAVLAVDVTSGGTVQLSRTFSEAGAIDGRFECSNPAFTLSQKQISVYALDVGAGVDAVTTVTAPAGAKDGDSCVVTLTYQLYNISGQQKIGETSKISWTVTVKNKSVVTEPTPTTTAPAPAPAPSTTAAPSTSAPAATTRTWTPSEPQTTPSAPSDGGNEYTNPAEEGGDDQPYTPSVDNNQPVIPNVDYTELNAQIKIAEGLTSSDYTKDSWEKLDQALTAANGLTSSGSQPDVDKAASALKSAIDSLVKMDYTALEKAIKDANGLRNSEKLAPLFDSLSEKLAHAAELLESGDQESVDKTAKELAGLIDDIKKEFDGMKDTKEVVKEVEVEVEPKDDFCNISIHKVWPILFWISFALNIAFIALIVLYVVRRRRSQADDTPLVDYNISDDDKE